MRLLHVYAGPYPTAQGTQVLVGQTASLLAEQGHEVHLLCYSQGSFDKTYPFTIHRIPNLPRYESERSGLHYKKLVLDLSLSLKAAALIKTLDPDLIHAHHYEALAAVAVADPTRSKPRVFHSHALFGPELPTYVRRPLRPFLGMTGRFVDKHLPQRADGIIAISREMQHTLESQLGPRMPIVLARPPFEPPPALVVDEYQRPGLPVQMIYTGNLDEYQGLGNLLMGLKKLDFQTVRKLGIQILTDSDPSELRERIRNNGLDHTIEFGPLDSWAKTYRKIQAADFMVVPRSLSNGVPIKMVNAMAAGCPVLVDYRLAKELRHNEEVYKIDMENPDMVAGSIARLTADVELRHRLSGGARAAALRLHEPQKVAGSIEDLYRKILGRWSKNRSSKLQHPPHTTSRGSRLRRSLKERALDFVS